MKFSRRFERIIRWYPSAWRARYGEGLAALLEDTYGERPVPRGVRVSLARAGVVERAREAGVVGSATSPNDRLRAGSLLVLCGWSFFVVAGAVFAKFTEHWSLATPAAHRTLPSISDATVRGAGAIGAIVVIVAGAFAAPTVVRLVRTQGWSSIRRPVLRATLAVACVATMTTGLALWAHQLSYQQRNGGLYPYGIGVLVTGVAALVAIATVTESVITISRRLNFSRQVLRLLSSLALALTLSMSVIVTAVALWWASEAMYAPHFLGSNIGGILDNSRAMPPALVIAGLLMLVGLASATVGAARVLGGLKGA